MENLKLTSIRLSKEVLDKANDLSRGLRPYRTSDILRVAIWLGLKFIKPRVIQRYLHMMWEEEEFGAHHTLEDVLRAAGGLVDDEHAAAL